MPLCSTNSVQARIGTLGSALTKTSVAKIGGPTCSMLTTMLTYRTW